MNTTIAGWLKVIGAGAAGAGGVITAGPLDMKTAVVACCTFLASAGIAASAFLQAPPAKSA